MLGEIMGNQKKISTITFSKQFRIKLNDESELVPNYTTFSCIINYVSKC